MPVRVLTDHEHVAEVRRLVGEAGGVNEVHELRTGYLEPSDEQASRPSARAEIGDCAALAVRARLPSCADGDVFFVDAPTTDQSRLREVEMPTGTGRFYSYEGGKRQSSPQWTVPGSVRHIPATESAQDTDGSLFITPAALGNVDIPVMSVIVYVGGAGTVDELTDRVATAVNRLAWHADVSTTDLYAQFYNDENQQFARFRSVLLATSMFVMAVAALSLLMLSVEQITERRRPLAALSAAGVPLSVLARGLLWQNAVPVLVGVVMAIAAGLGLTAPILRVADMPMTLDAIAIGGLAATAVLAVLVVTGLTLPLLRQVTRLESLRAE